MPDLPHQLRLALPALALLLGACATKKAELPVYPAAPEPARYAYEFTLRSQAEIDDKASMKRLAVGRDIEKSRFEKPRDVAARNGRVYVADTMMKRIHAFDVGQRSYFTFGFRLEGKLEQPVALAVDQAGQVYVADNSQRRVVVYDGLGLYVRSIGGPEDLDRPTGVAVSPDGATVWVLDGGGIDSKRHRLLAFDGASGKLKQAIGTRGGKPGEFNLPSAVATAPDGSVYVLDSGNFRVQKFTADGQFALQWGSVGNGLGQFARPRDLTIDGQGKVFVSDAAFGNIQVFDGEGQMLMHLGDFGSDDLPGVFVMLAGIGTDETGRVYAVDQFLRKVSIFKPVGGG